MSLARFVDDTVERLRGTPVDLSLLPADAFHGSIYTGGAGVAYFLHEAARLRDDASLRELARRWRDATNAWVRTASQRDWRGFSRGFVIGEAGAAYVDGLLSVFDDDAPRALAAARRIDALSARFDDLGRGIRPTELFGGAAGILLAARDMASKLPISEAHSEARTALEDVQGRATASLLGAHAERSSMASGLAHGAAGELMALIAAVGVEHDVVAARLAELADAREQDDEGFIYWACGSGDGTDGVGLVGTCCNGVPGLALLWCEVARRAPQARWLALARRSAKTIEVLRNDDPGLCCGLAGQSLALQTCAEACDDVGLARRAYERLSRAARIHERTASETDLRLWHGPLGVALVAMWRLHRARPMPGLALDL